MGQSSLTEGEAAPTASFARLRTARIVEVHVRRLATPEDLELLDVQVSAAVRRAGPGAVICADHRYASPFSEKVADLFSRSMRGNNRSIGRSALLLSPANAMYNLQVERVVSCAGSNARRLFADLDELRRWIGDSLPLPERDALRQLFSDEEALTGRPAGP
jgi:hypothetical protein